VDEETLICNWQKLKILNILVDEKCGFGYLQFFSLLSSLWFSIAHILFSFFFFFFAFSFYKDK
jgi:hypothetical protein